MNVAWRTCWTRRFCEGESADVVVLAVVDDDVVGVSRRMARVGARATGSFPMLAATCDCTRESDSGG